MRLLRCCGQGTLFFQGLKVGLGLIRDLNAGLELFARAEETFLGKNEIRLNASKARKNLGRLIAGSEDEGKIKAGRGMLRSYRRMLLTERAGKIGRRSGTGNLGLSG